MGVTMIEKYTCDRCGDEIPRKKFGMDLRIVTKVTLLGTSRNFEALLCDKCRSKQIRFMQGAELKDGQ